MNEPEIKFDTEALAPKLEVEDTRKPDPANIRPIITHPNPILQEECEPFDFKNPQMDPVKLAEILYDNMIHYNGIGLAANQIGLQFQAFIMRGSPCYVVINGRIVDESEEKVYLEEGCLSYPDLFCKIRRPLHIKVRFADPTGEMQNEKFTGMTARVFQHEMDHMQGLDCFRLASPIHMSKARKDKKLIGRKRKRFAKKQKFESFQTPKEEVLTINTGV